MATRSWNRVELIGNLTRDPEIRYTPNGAAVCTFSIATNRTYLVEGERKEEADFHRCVAWNKLAELCSQLLKKGNRVFVSGRLQNRSWEGQDGQQRQTTEIVIEDMILLTSRGGETGSVESFSEDVSSPAPAPSTASLDDLPEEKKEEKTPVSDDSEKKEEKKDLSAGKQDKPTQEDPGDLDDLPF